MTLAEFQMRRLGFNQEEVRKWQRTRKIAYAALTAFYQDPKTLPKKETHYLPLPGDEVIRATQNSLKLYDKLMDEYLEKKRAKMLKE